MSGAFFPSASAGGYPSENLMLIELRVLTEQMQQLIGSQENTPILQLRNDEATALSIATPIPST